MIQRANSSPTGTEPHDKRDQGSERIHVVVAHLQERGVGACAEGARLLQSLLELPIPAPNVRITVDKAARLVGVSPRSLLRRCSRAAMPGPSRVIAFGRVLNTLCHLRNPGRTVSDAANATGWPDGYACSQSLYRLTGLRPTVARHCDLVEVAEAWLQNEEARR